MNRTRFPRAWAVVWTLMLMAVTGVGAWRFSQRREAERAIEQLRSELTTWRRQRTNEVDALARLRQQVEQQLALSAAATAGLNRALKDVAAAAAPLLWTEPPEQLPDWNPASPFIWLNKTSLTNLPIDVFDEEGRLGAEAAAVWSVPPETLTSLNVGLAHLLEAFQAAERSRAEVSGEHLPGIGGETGEKLTIKVPPMPEEGVRFEREFEELLRSHLGDVRAELVKSTALEWISSHFSQFGTEPRIISICRHPRGTFNIAIRAGLTWLSTGGLQDISAYVPSHLRSFFSPLTDTKPEVSGDLP